MKLRTVLMIVPWVALAGHSAESEAAPLGSSITYQGRLTEAGDPLNGTADLQFQLFDAPTDGTPIGGAQLASAVEVVDGLFTVPLDFGAIPFTGEARWIEVSVRSPAGAGLFTILSPRQSVTPAPYALYALDGPGGDGWQLTGAHLTNTNTGNVGIGTSAPSTKLHVAAPIPILRLQDSDSIITQTGMIDFMDSGGASSGYMGFGSQATPHLYLVNRRSSGDLRLHTSDLDRVTVTATGNVGIGTTTPGKKLTVAGDMEIGTSTADYRHLRLGGGNCSGFLYGSFPALGDGIHLGYNYYADAGGVHRIVATDGQTSRISMGYGYISLATGPTNNIPLDRIHVTTNGNVGIGTNSPTAKLQVNGTIKHSFNGQYFAPASSEGLRIIRGTVDAAGNAVSGAGFTSSRVSQGDYLITFSTVFAGNPSVTATADDETVSSAARVATIFAVGSNSVRVRIRNLSNNVEDQKFHFCVIGPH